MTEVAASLSLPEILLLLERHERRELTRVLLDTHSRHLTTAGVWSQRATEALRRFQKELLEQSRHEPPKPATNADLSAAFAGWGVDIHGQ